MGTAAETPQETDVDAARALRIVESMPGFAWSADSTGRFTYVSPSALAYLGHARQDLNDSEQEDEFGWRRVVHPDDYDRVAARWRHCLATGAHYDTEHRLLSADGVYRWFRNSGWPSRDGHGRIAEWYGTTIDIDEQKRAEAALLDRERALSQLVDMVPSHLWRLTPDGEPTFFSKRMVDFTGLDLADTDRPGSSRIEVVIQTVIHPEDAVTFGDALRRSLLTGESFALRYRLRRADGVYHWMSSRAEPMRDQDGRIVQWYGLCHDIDDQVKAEEALRRSERELSQLVDMIPGHVWRLTPGGEPSFINKRLSDFLGIDVVDYDQPGMSRLAAAIQTSAHPDDSAGIGEAIGHSLTTGEHFSMRWRVRRKDGVYRWVESRAEPLRDESGAILRWYGVNVDVDDQVRAQEALRDRERELSQLVDIVPSLLWRLTPDGEPVFFSKRMIDFFGLDVGDPGGPGTGRLAAVVEAVVHPDDARGLKEALNRSLVTGERFSLKYRLRRADGVYRWMDGRAEPLRDEGGRILQWYGLSHDIDDQVHAEEALRESERSLRQLVETLPAMIDCAAPDGEPIYRSR
ncbi:MAG: PAS domain-containing protein, partial [Bauldia sp.]|nr:PAS domain-containing protein [Bauldia sp.]